MEQPSTSKSTIDSNKKCAICSSEMNEGLIECTAKGKESLKNASIERDDNLLSNADVSKSIFVHPSCRKNYVNERNISAAKRKSKERKSLSISPPKRKLRKSLDASSSCSNESTSCSSFNWKQNCFICEKEADIEKEKKLPVARRKKIVTVTLPSFKTNLTILLTPLNDDYHRGILRRIQMEGLSLVDLQAKYHLKCYTDLANAARPGLETNAHSSNIDSAMEDIYNFMLSSSECQFTLTQLKEAIKISNVIPSEKTIVSRLKEKFGSKIVISSRMGGVTYICYTNDLYDILTTSWYNRRKPNSIEEEENQLIDSAAELIRRKIRTTVCPINEYPASDDFLTNVNKNIPLQLIRFLRHIIYKDKEQTTDNELWYSKRITSISHAITSAARPKSFLSPLQLATGTTFHRKFGSRKIIELCHELGFSCSYSEVQRYETCAALQANRSLTDPFIQIVSDNSDFNICTIDGRSTFHYLGSIEIITPASSLQKRLPIKRIMHSEIPKAAELIDEQKIDIQLYTQTPGTGLKSIAVETLDKDPSFKETLISKLNILWMFYKYRTENNFMGWNGFMSLMTGLCTDYAVSTINFLPFINAAPSDYSTLYTVLKYAYGIVEKEGMKTCLITFDQPLYIKARDIVAAMNFYGTQVVVRLGCFHLLMSFMGCIGYIMAGSGLKEILSVIYAEGSVDKILDGHSYARAVRAHCILQQALSLLIFEKLKEENVEFQQLLENEDIFTFDMDIDRIQINEYFEKLNVIFESKLQKIEAVGKTCKLWVLYFRMVTLLKNIIAAERMGDWKSHLECVELTIPFFHSAGHFNYAKSARLYLQDMRKLEEVMDPIEYQKFTDGGYFTSRRSNAYFSGIFSDQTIEQTLMRAMSVEGGPFKRGATPSVVMKWIKGVLFTKDIVESLEEFCDIEFNKSHQHVDSRDARIERDAKDVGILKQYLLENYPFEDIEHLQNIVTGLVGTDEINCHEALSIGIETMKSIDGLNFNEIKLSKKNKVIPLLGVNSKIKVGNKFVVVDPLLLFQRICIMKKSDEELESYMKFELAPYPLSLYDDIGMRKPSKSSFYSSFKTLETIIQKQNCQFYIDGGLLLYKPQWPTSECKFEIVFGEYTSYVQRNFGNNAIVVFDCYEGISNKASERYRRSRKVTSKEFNFTKDSKVTVTQEKFLTNYKNKSRLISFLMQEFQKKNINCYQGKGEADELLVDIAVKDDSNLTKVVVAEDTDILVILTGRANAGEEIYFLKMGKQNASAVYSSKSLAIDYPNSSSLVVFCHSFTGCDSTSAFYNKGKKKFIDILEKRPDVRDKAKVFYDKSATVKDILEAGHYCTIMLYGSAKDTQVHKMQKIKDLPAYLEKMRYASFIRAATTKKIAVKLSSLVPTIGALNEHIKRVFLQVQLWMGNKIINPLDWGWIQIDDTLSPIKTPDPPAPEELLKVIFCGCKKGCGSSCGCRKIGLFCNLSCTNCSGDHCENSAPTMDQEDHVEDEDEIEEVGSGGRTEREEGSENEQE